MIGSRGDHRLVCETASTRSALTRSRRARSVAPPRARVPPLRLRQSQTATNYRHTDVTNARADMSDRHARPTFSLVLMLLVLARGYVPGDTVAQPSAPAATADPLVFDTWVPGPCSPNGQPQGQCPPGDLFRVRLVAIAEGLKSPRHMAFTADGDLLITELAEAPSAVATGNQAIQGRAGQVRVVRRGS